MFLTCLQYGRAALEIVMKSIVQLDRPLVPPPESYKGDFMKGKSLHSHTSIIVLNQGNTDRSFVCPVLFASY